MLRQEREEVKQMIQVALGRELETLIQKKLNQILQKSLKTLKPVLSDDERLKLKDGILSELRDDLQKIVGESPKNEDVKKESETKTDKKSSVKK